ncbi:MAG: hypothetical protein Kow00121_07140 [Elainellaceae cyanobacterium]
MTGLESLCIFALVLIAFPFSLVQLEIALNQNYDMEAFTLWTFIAGMMAGIPFMLAIQ